jgi:hypothetical protein
MPKRETEIEKHSNRSVHCVRKQMSGVDQGSQCTEEEEEEEEEENVQVYDCCFRRMFVQLVVPNVGSQLFKIAY